MDMLLTFLRQDADTSKGESASDKALRQQLQDALDLISSLVTLFPLEHLALTFNGGKDACVVFYLVRAALALRRVTTKEELARVKVLYFAPKHGEFPEVTSFMEEVVRTFDFTYTVYPPGCSYKEGMRDLVEREGLKAVFLGVRSGDPYSLESEHLQPSSPGWPVFLRVNPILKWDYGQVWRFLRRFNLPYCSLYDEGYTSLGDIRTTIRNPALLKEGGKEGGREGSEEKERYRPAHELVDWTLERANRIVAEEGEGEGEGGKKKETKTDMEAGGNRRSVPTTPPTTMATTTVAGDEGTGSGRWNENVSSSSLPRHVSSGSLPRHVSRGNMANEDGEGEGAGRLQGRLQQQQQQQVSLPPPRHMRRLSSFAERLPVALLCVGDFLSDSAPMALAHELRELRCRVAPIIITPRPSLSKEAGNEKEKEEEEEGGEMFSLQKMAVAQSTTPLFVLCVNEETHAEVRQRLSTLLGCKQHGTINSSSSSSISNISNNSYNNNNNDNNNNNNNESKGRGEITMTAAAAHDKAWEKEGEEEGIGAVGSWQASSRHVEQLRHVYLLSPRFLHHVSLASQKAELAALLDAILM
ncbi:hypothetical protein VYU27_004937 [Nannochloropsis oceanica]